VASDDGFTLIEMVVALIVFALVASALAGVLIGSARGQLFAQKNTAAKNFAQQQVDAMRSLPYHVDAQNGPYVDLLDLYFPNALTTVTTIPNIIPGQNVSGNYVASGAATATSPAGPYYQVTIPGNLVSAKLASFAQVVYTQFLNANNPAATPIAASLIPSTYNNAVVGADLPVSPLLGVTVVTSWTLNGVVHNLTTFTEISNEGTDTSLVVNQAKAAAVRVLTQDRNKNAITATLASVTANGSVSNSSSAGAEALGASVVYTDATNPLAPVRVEVDGAKQTVASPPNPNLTPTLSGTPGAVSPIPTGAPGCGWASFGPTQDSDVTSTTASGLPVVPSDATASSGSPTVAAALQSNGGGACAGMYFSNQIDTTLPTNPALGLNSSSPMVQVQDLTGGGSEVTGQANIYTAFSGGAPGAVTSHAATGMGTWLKIFPGLSFVPPVPSGAYPTGSPGLVNVELTDASLSCQSVGGQSGATSQAVLTYDGIIAWWTYNAVPQNGWHTAPFSFTAASTTDPLAGIGLNLASPLNSTGTLKLSNYITSAVGATGAAPSDGVQGVEAAVAITTVPTLVDSLGNAYPGSALGVELGHLSCVAMDNR
jgi:prepilin-type N-terminal cleavage/methylation domain-containing protein